MTMRLVKTSELSSACLKEIRERLPGSGWWMAVEFCPECGMWVIERAGSPLGHKLRCSKPKITFGPSTHGWEVPVNGSMVQQVVKSLVGLRVQLRSSGGKFYLCESWETPRWGPWDVAEGFMRLGFLPPGDLIAELQELPEGHSGRRLWTLRGARRALRSMHSDVRVQEIRVREMMRKMFPRGLDRQPQGEIELPTTGLGLKGE